MDRAKGAEVSREPKTQCMILQIERFSRSAQNVPRVTGCKSGDGRL